MPAFEENAPSKTANASPATGHVGLNVTDLGRSRRFYEQALGFRVLHESSEEGRRFAFLGVGDRIVLTLWQQSGDGFSPARAGLHHLSFQVPTLERVREVESRLRALGARFLHPGLVSHSEGADSGGIFFADPDGIRLEVYCLTGLAGVAPAAGHGPSCGFF